MSIKDSVWNAGVALSSIRMNAKTKRVRILASGAMVFLELIRDAEQRVQLSAGGASVETQDNEPVCECGHLRELHLQFLNSEMKDTRGKCIADNCGCSSYRHVV